MAELHLVYEDSEYLMDILLGLLSTSSVERESCPVGPVVTVVYFRIEVSLQLNVRFCKGLIPLDLCGVVSLRSTFEDLG